MVTVKEPPALGEGGGVRPGDGGAALTVRAKFWVASVPTPLAAVMVKRRCPGARRRGARQGGGAVTVVDEGHPGGQGARLRRAAGRAAAMVTVKEPALALGEGGRLAR